MPELSEAQAHWAEPREFQQEPVSDNLAEGPAEAMAVESLAEERVADTDSCCKNPVVRGSWPDEPLAFAAA